MREREDAPESPRRAKDAAERARRFARLAASACAAVLLTIVAAPAPAKGPVGKEYPIGDRAPAPPGWWTSCTYGGANVVEVGLACDGDCSASRRLVLSRHHVSGQPIAEDVVIDGSRPAGSGFRIACSSTGWATVQWIEEDDACPWQQTFDPTSVASRPASRAISDPEECDPVSSFAVGDDGATFLAWFRRTPDYGYDLVALRIAPDGATPSAPTIVGDQPVALDYGVKIAADETGSVLMVWRGEEEGADGRPVLGRFLDDGARVASPVYTIDTFPYRDSDTTADPAVQPLGGGSFEVSWTNPYEGGRVARRIESASAGAADMEPPAPLVAPAAPTASSLSFGAARTIDVLAGYQRAADPVTELDYGGKSVWTAGSSMRDYANGRLLSYRSADGSSPWERMATGEASGSCQEADGNGNWVRASVSRGDLTLHASISVDDGATWILPTELGSCADLGGNGANCQPAALDAASSAGGIRVVAASYRMDAERPRDEIAAWRSGDGGASWSRARIVAGESGAGRAGFDLATDGNGTWILAWMDEDLLVARSTDNGKSWGAPAIVRERVGCTDCGAHARHHRISLAADASGGWILAFSGAKHSRETFGYDGDVFVVRSTDRGKTWSDPIAVAAYAATDASPDFSPSLATDGAGAAVLVWATHHPTSETDGLDADVVAAISLDGGRQWSRPERVAEGTSDWRHDVSPVVASGGEGRWRVAWQSGEYEREHGRRIDRLLVATSPSACGNGAVEPGEQCDDGNRDDGDGCDHDCTDTACGNGIVTGEEVCDDGNLVDGDGCTSRCTIPGCGDGILETYGEECDDGNTVDTDACTNACDVARCGDGIVHEGVEACDSGEDRLAPCNRFCQPAVCGDGDLRPYFEACDDGANERCPEDCSLAICGDRVTSYGFEECDPTDRNSTTECSADCRLRDLCGDVDADGSVTVRDALRILRKSVDATRLCPMGICDLDGNGTIAARDALLGLFKSVGIEVKDKCSVGDGWISFWIDEPREIASLMFEVEYFATGGEFVGDGAAVECENDDDKGLVAVHDVDGFFLRAAVITLEPFDGFTEFLRCRFEAGTPVRSTAASRFLIRNVAATDSHFQELIPPPLIGYRVE